MGRHILPIVMTVVAFCATSGIAHAQIDLSGEWALRMHEDQPWRGPGQLPGEFQGLPINDAAKAKAASWNASVYAMPERQCIPFPMDMAYTFGNMRIWKVKDGPSQENVAFGQHNEWQAQERTIWMDGRPHPPEWAPHTWQGFSTGQWIGTSLKVTTTHLKMAYLERNGVPRSDQATVVEYYSRHDNILTIVTIVTDPVYLTEPWVRTRNFAAAPAQELNAYPCRPAIEIARPAHTVPHYLPGTNPSLDAANKRFGVPLAALQGGAETAYPEYARQLVRARDEPATAHRHRRRKRPRGALASAVQSCGAGAAGGAGNGGLQPVPGTGQRVRADRPGRHQQHHSQHHRPGQ